MAFVSNVEAKVHFQRLKAGKLGACGLGCAGGKRVHDEHLRESMFRVLGENNIEEFEYNFGSRALGQWPWDVGCGTLGSKFWGPRTQWPEHLFQGRECPAVGEVVAHNQLTAKVFVAAAEVEYLKA